MGIIITFVNSSIKILRLVGRIVTDSTSSTCCCSCLLFRMIRCCQKVNRIAGNRVCRGCSGTSGCGMTMDSATRWWSKILMISFLCCLLFFLLGISPVLQVVMIPMLLKLSQQRDKVVLCRFFSCLHIVRNIIRCHPVERDEPCWNEWKNAVDYDGYHSAFGDTTRSFSQTALIDLVKRLES